MAQLDFCFKIDNVSCGGCKAVLLNLLDDKNKSEKHSFEIINSDLDIQSKILKITVDSVYAHAKILEALKSWLETEVLNDSKFKINQEYFEQVVKKHKTISIFENSHLIGVILGLAFGIFWMCVTLGFVFLTPLLNSLMIFSNSLILLYIAKPFFQNAFQQLRHAWKTSGPKVWFTMDSLFSLTGLIVIGVSIASLFSPLFSCMLEAGFLIFGFRHLGIIFQSFLDNKLDFSKSLVSSFKDKSYQLGHSDARKLAKDFIEGELMSCKTGDVIPVDGIIESFSNDISLIDNLKNGSYFPLDLPKIGQKVLAGTTIDAGQLKLRVEATIDKSRFSFIDKSVSGVRSNLACSPIVNKTQTWLQWFIPGLLLLSLLSGILVGHFLSLTLAIECSVSILVSACPCTLGLIIPMALRMGAYKASLHQAVFKSGEAIQQAAQTDIVVLDYNGTLTHGKPEVKNFEFFSDKTFVFQTLYAIEQKMLKKRPGQIIGLAISRELSVYMKQNGILEKDFSGADFVDFNFAASLKTNEGIFWFGNNQMLEFLEADIEKNGENRHYLLFKANNAEGYQLLAQLDIEDKLRSDAVNFVQALKKRNKQVVVCTGASGLNAQKIHKVLGLEEEMVKIQCTPHDKTKQIEQLRTKFPNKVLAMLGDGVNDKPALEASDLKIWMKNQNLSPEFNIAHSANLEIHSEQLISLIHAFDISEQTFKLIYQNLAFSLTYNFLILSFACGSLLIGGLTLHPAIGVCLMIIQSALLGLNTYRTLLMPNETPEGFQESDLQRRMTMATS